MSWKIEGGGYMHAFADLMGVSSRFCLETQFDLLQPADADPASTFETTDCKMHLLILGKYRLSIETPSI